MQKLRLSKCLLSGFSVLTEIIHVIIDVCNLEI